MCVKQFHFNFIKLIINTHITTDRDVDFIDLPSSVLLNNQVRTLRINILHILS